MSVTFTPRPSRHQQGDRARVAIFVTLMLGSAALSFNGRGETAGIVVLAAAALGAADYLLIKFHGRHPMTPTVPRSPEGYHRWRSTIPWTDAEIAAALLAERDLWTSKGNDFMADRFAVRQSTFPVAASLDGHTARRSRAWSCRASCAGGAPSIARALLASVPRTVTRPTLDSTTAAPISMCGQE
jgi:hypothetical protein